MKYSKNHLQQLMKSCMNLENIYLESIYKKKFINNIIKKFYYSKNLFKLVISALCCFF